MDKELLKILFKTFDMIECEDKNIVIEDALIEIGKLYGKDFVDTNNCYLNYIWSEIDKVNGDEIIQNYING